MKNHFLSKDSPNNRIKYSIFQLMVHFEEMYDVMDDLLSFRVEEEKAKDQLEDHLISMESIHLTMAKDLRKKEESHTEQQQIDFETSTLYEGVRRTYNLLTSLNIIDLDASNWVYITTRSLIEKHYYKQIKASVYYPEKD